MEKDVVCGMQVDPAKAAGTSEREAIGALHAEGIRVVMLTGDNRTTADAVARTWVSITSKPTCFPTRRRLS